ncbi:SAF domain-containing protein [Brachybacterium paraconglomeratum]|uniref:SAF domain-containing protein n=1 Tax=Brachybacterium paraconglomeratum TaxID=173362 RepID=UPI0031F0E03D
MLSRFRHHLPHWRRVLRRRRRLLAVLALAVAVTAVLPSFLPPSAQGVRVIVANEDLPVGTVLGPEHLRTVRTAVQLVPAEAPTKAEDVLGRTTALPVPAGTPLLDPYLSADGQPALPKGAVLMVVPVPDLLAPHLSPGTDIELLVASTSQDARKSIAAQVVRSVPTTAPDAALSGSGTGSSQILVAVGRSRAGELAHALGAGTLMVAVIG